MKFVSLDKNNKEKARRIPLMMIIGSVLSNRKIEHEEAANKARKID